jgi:hypothetical protein
MSSIWGGQNKTLDQDINKLGNIGDWATGEGKSDVNSGTNFWKSILSGDSSKQMQELGGTIGSAKTSLNQDTKTATSNAAKTDQFHGWMTNLLGSLTGNAANSLTSTGQSLMGTGLSAYGQQIGASQQQMANWAKSIGGHAMISGVQSLEELGEQYLAGPEQTSAADTYSGAGV